MQSHSPARRTQQAQPDRALTLDKPDPSGGMGNAALQDFLKTQGGGESTLAGDGDLLLASATDEKNFAKDGNSYTKAMLAVQKEHPDWPLAQVVREVQSRDVNGLGSELAITNEARLENGEGVGFKGALIIGNGAYTKLPTLPGAAADATAMAGSYGGKGYEIDHQTDLTASAMSAELGMAGVGLGEGDEFLIYYAGHAYSKGLLGVDGTNKGENSVPYGRMLGAANRMRGAGVKTEVVLDACQTGAAVDQAVADDAAAKDSLPPGLEPTPAAKTPAA
jgi:hypothetical protein